MLDGIAGREYDAVLLNPDAFSEDGRRLAYVAVRGDKWLVVADGEEGKEYHGIGARDNWQRCEYQFCINAQLHFAKYGKHLAYVARRGDEWFVVSDGVEGKPYDDIGVYGPVFSWDGKRLAYAVRRGEKWLVIEDGVAGKEYDDVHEAGPVFSPGDQHLAYAAKRAGKWLVVMDGVEGGKYDAVDWFGKSFSPDGRHLAFWARRGRKWAIVLDEISIGDYDQLIDCTRIVFDGDSLLHAVARRGNDILRVEVAILT